MIKNIRKVKKILFTYVCIEGWQRESTWNYISATEVQFRNVENSNKTCGPRSKLFNRNYYLHMSLLSSEAREQTQDVLYFWEESYFGKTIYALMQRLLKMKRKFSPELTSSDLFGGFSESICFGASKEGRGCVSPPKVLDNIRQTSLEK
jgi:hypothetical protein